MRAITYNNFACLYRKTNHLRNALSFLEKALEIEYGILNSQSLSVSEGLAVSNPCEIHLNICAILSQLNKHEQALHHALKALILIQDEILELAVSGAPAEARHTVLVIALHNIAVEYEFLKQYDTALHSYKKAKDTASAYLGEEHPFTQKMDRVLQESQDKMKSIKARMQTKDKKKTSQAAK